MHTSKNLYSTFREVLIELVYAKIKERTICIHRKSINSPDILKFILVTIHKSVRSCEWTKCIHLFFILRSEASEIKLILCWRAHHRNSRQRFYFNTDLTRIAYLRITKGSTIMKTIVLLQRFTVAQFSSKSWVSLIEQCS